MVTKDNRAKYFASISYVEPWKNDGKYTYSYHPRQAATCDYNLSNSVFIKPEIHKLRNDGISSFSHVYFIPPWVVVYKQNSLLSLRLGQGADDVRITSVRDGQSADAVVPTASSSQLNVVAAVVMHSSLGQHGVVLDLGLPARGEAKDRKQISRRTLGADHHHQRGVIDGLVANLPGMRTFH